MSDPRLVLSQLLSPAQADTLTEAGRTLWQTAVPALEGVLGAAPSLTEISGRLAMPEELIGDFASPHIVLPFEVSTDRDQSAKAYLVLPTAVAALFLDTGADNEAEQEQQTMVVASTVLSQVAQALNSNAFPKWSAGVALALDEMQANSMSDLLANFEEPVLAFSATLAAGKALPFTLILPGTFLDILAGAAPAPAPAAKPKSSVAIDPTLGFTLTEEEIAAAELIEEMPAPEAPRPAAGSAASGDASREPTPISQGPRAARARFAPLNEPDRQPARNGIDLIANLHLNVTVELGRTELTVAEVLGLGPGSVVELDRLAGEPVDILVNDRLVARGEVVVVDENFGVRVVEVVRRGQEVEERAG